MNVQGKWQELSVQTQILSAVAKVFSLYTLVQSTNGIRRSLKHFRDAFLFTVTQILMWCFLSKLHFHTPLGAGGAGALPRRVRTAYSRTRCLPHLVGASSVSLAPPQAAGLTHSAAPPLPTKPEGGFAGAPVRWASTPTGRLCGVLAGRSLWACKVTIRTAGRCGLNLSSSKIETSALPLP